MVSVTLALGAGSSHDPVGKEGLSHMTAQMLDEGAGPYDGPALAAAFESLGTSLRVEVDADAAAFSFTVLKENLAPAVALLADVIQRPRFAEKDFARAHGLWVDALRARADDADAVARVVMRKAVMGDGMWSHPWSGTLAGASKVKLTDIRRHYRDLYQSPEAHFAVAGDVTSSELTVVLEASFARWKHPGRLWMRGTGTGQLRPPRLVIVDRPGAPQAVVGFARVGLSATDPSLPGVMRANIALGGSFTSRLNQDLREKHGWTYGARSAFSVSSSPGLMVAWAAVQTDATIEASKALLVDVREFAHKGLTDDEVSKTRATMNAEFVRSYSTIDAVVARLAQHAIFFKPLDADAQLLKVATSLDGSALNALAKTHFATDEGTFVIVGPMERFRARLSDLGLGDPQLRDAEGQVIKSP
jgi:predicted Zn-dependent peptidase